MSFHGLFGTGHLYEDRTLLAFDNRSQHGESGLGGLRSEGTPTQESPVSLGEGNFDPANCFGLHVLALGILELLHPTVDVGFDPTGAATAEIKEHDFPGLAGFSGDGELSLAHIRGGRR